MRTATKTKTPNSSRSDRSGLIVPKIVFKTLFGFFTGRSCFAGWRLFDGAACAMSEVSKNVVAAVVELANVENPTDPKQWLQDQRVAIVRGLVAAVDGRVRQSTLNSKSVTFWLEMSSRQKLDALTWAEEEIIRTEATDVTELQTDPALSYADFSRAKFI